MNKVIMYVEGGNVQIHASNPKELEIVLFDVDNMKAEGKSGAQIDKEWKKISKGTKVVC